MKIYTKRGDGGETGLKGGLRVPKDDVRIEANGTIDELNAVLGVVRALLTDIEKKQRIERLQQLLMTLMGGIAGGELPKEVNLPALTAEMELEIDTMDTSAKFCFVVPGDHLLNAYLHLARTKARTAERRLWTMHRSYTVDHRILQFFNRLSDYLFMLSTCAV